MKLVKTVAELQAIVKETKKAGKSIGLVPTMGALHEGHASLIKAAHAENDFTIVSDFVNPTQFGPTEDLDAYPRTLEHDCELAEKMGADVLFVPSPKEMYPSRDMTWVEVTGDITKVLCGRTRPIHFRGVATVVSKLFNLTQPDKAYFGQKDAQQAQVLKRMVKDLFFPLEIRVMPIIRETDGLAKSSRNVITDSKNYFKSVLAEVRKAPILKAHYVSDPATVTREKYVKEVYQLPELAPAEATITTDHLLAVAVKFGTTRLIDNVVLEV